MTIWAQIKYWKAPVIANQNFDMVKKSAEFFLGKNYEMLKRKFEKALATLGKINVIDDVFVN